MTEATGEMNAREWAGKLTRDNPLSCIHEYSGPIQDDIFNFADHFACHFGERQSELHAEQLALKDKAFEVLLAYHRKLEAELQGSDIDFVRWVREKISKCCPWVCRAPRTDELVATKYEIMGWMHVLCAELSAGRGCYTDIAIEHQTKADDANERADRVEAENVSLRANLTETLAAALDAQQRCEKAEAENTRLKGGKFSDRDYTAMKSRAGQAEARCEQRASSERRDWRCF